MNYHALCFVDMPFGQKPDLKSGVVVDFDQIYNEAIKPAIEASGLEALRGDEERTGGIIHGAMFARLLLAEFVVADFSGNPGFMELLGRMMSAPRCSATSFSITLKLPLD